MKIILESLVQTSRTCPATWTGKTVEGDPIEIHFRLGRLNLKVNDRVEITTERSEFDISSYIELPEALKLLEKAGVECE